VILRQLRPNRIKSNEKRARPRPLRAEAIDSARGQAPLADFGDLAPPRVEVPGCATLLRQRFQAIWDFLGGALGEQAAPRSVISGALRAVGRPSPKSRSGEWYFLPRAREEGTRYMMPA
jgi:hypothetical protein